MSECSITASAEAKNWPEGLISAKITMNPYILAMAGEECFKHGMKLWEFINLAVWEKLGRPSHQELIESAVRLEIFDEDPKWKKRLRLAAQHEVAAAEMRKQVAEELETQE